MLSDTSFSYRRTAINSISNVLGFAARAVIGFFLLRYIVHQLGPVEYSIVPLVGACMSYLLLLNLGTGMGMARYMSAAHARGENDEVTKVYTSMFLVLALIGAILLLAGLLVSWQFSRIFTIPSSLEKVAMVVMSLTVLSSAFRMPFNVLQSAFVATDSYWLSNAIGAGSDVLRAIITVAFFEVLGSSVVWTAVAQTMVILITTACEWYAVRRILPCARIDLALFDPRMAFKVMSFSLAVFVGSISGILYWDTDKIIINKCLSAEELTIFAVVLTIALSLYQLLNVPINVLFPTIVRAQTTKNLQIVREIIYRGTRLCVLMGLPCWILFVVFADPFFNWYLGVTYQNIWSFVPFLAVANFFSGATSVIRLIPVPMGKPVFISVAELVFGFLNVILVAMFVILFGWGLAGLAIAACVVISLKNVILVPVYVARLVNLEILCLLKNVFYAALPSGIMCILIVVLHSISPNMSLPWFFAVASFVLMILIISSYAIGLPEPERKKLDSVFATALNTPSRIRAYYLRHK